MTEFIDEFGLPEHFVETLHSVQQVGPCKRLVFTIYQPSTDGTRRLPIGVCKLVLPAEAALEVIRMLRASDATPVLASFQTDARPN